MDRCRSPVPDLLFEDVCAARVQALRPYLQQPEAVNGATPLHRVTVFLTYQCNLDCLYCKTIARDGSALQAFPQKAGSFNCQSFAGWLQSLAETPVQHAHFTGGEAALVKKLPVMLQQAKQHGVPHLSLTSNGTLPWAIYQALAENGLDEIRISLDAYEPALGEALTRRKGAWRAAVDNLRRLAAWRDQGHALFLIANTVVSERNRQDLAALVRFFLDLGVNDVKLISMVQEKETLGAFPEAARRLQEVAELLAAYPAEAFPLLRCKLHTVFAPEAVGLEDVRRVAGQTWHCYIPLTERTVDRLYYYPCSVYLREGGAPLGRIAEPLALQRAKTAAFVRQSNCLEDPICRRYCLHCTKQFNVAANRARWQ